MIYEIKSINVKELKSLLDNLEEDSIIKVYNQNNSKFENNFFIDSFKCVDDGKHKTLFYI